MEVSGYYIVWEGSLNIVQNIKVEGVILLLLIILIIIINLGLVASFSLAF